MPKKYSIFYRSLYKAYKAYKATGWMIEIFRFLLSKQNLADLIRQNFISILVYFIYVAIEIFSSEDAISWWKSYKKKKMEQT